MMPQYNRSISHIVPSNCTKKEASDNSLSLGQTEVFEWHTHFKTSQLLDQDVFSGGGGGQDQKNAKKRKKKQHL